VLWLVSPDDREQQIACMAVGGTTIEVPWPPGPADFAKKHRRGWEESSFDWYFAGADDLEFTEGWDIVALAEAESTGAKVVGTNDMANPMVKRGQHATHMMFARDYVATVGATWHDGPGIVYSEAYDHQRVDDEAVAAAKMRGVWAFAADSVVIHHHPIFDRDVPMDDTYRKALAKGQEDGRVFAHRRALALREQARAR
jgi:hypothetical protein